VTGDRQVPIKRVFPLPVTEMEGKDKLILQ
jgi:hypothetical protein